MKSVQVRASNIKYKKALDEKIKSETLVRLNTTEAVPTKTKLNKVMMMHMKVRAVPSNIGYKKSIR